MTRRDQRSRWPLAVAVAAGWGLLAGWWTPRSPVTTSQALWSIVISVAVGLAAGAVVRSRWSLLAAPVVVELNRLGSMIGQPPYREMLDYETALAHEEQFYPYDHTGNSEGVGGFSESFIVPEYALIDQVHLLGSFMDTFAVLYPQAQGLDVRTDVLAQTAAAPR